MYMRGKFFYVIVLFAAVMGLSSCVNSIESPGDELKMYSWSVVTDNGTAIALNFTDTDGFLDIEGEDDSLHIGGLCMTTRDSLLIFDKQSGVDYSFGYRLHGDRVELNRNGSILTLKKIYPQ